MHREHFELAILSRMWGRKFAFRERRQPASAGPAGKRALFMAEDVSFVVARRFRNAAEPITEISLNVDGGARTRKKRRRDPHLLGQRHL